MKATLHIPTEQYGFVEFEMDTSPKDSDKVFKLYNAMMKSRDGESDSNLNWDELKESKFNEVIDDYRKGKISADDYADLSVLQKQVVQVIKRSIKRDN